MEQMMFDLSPDATVYQSNSLAMANYDMTTLEQKLFLILVSTITKDDDCFKESVFRVVDLADLMGVSTQMLYRDLKKICKSLITKVVEVKSDNGDWAVFNIISSAKYIGNSGTISLKINSEAKPYLIQLKKLFFTFQLDHILNMDGKYAIRIYQQAKSNLFKGNSYVIELDEFKKQLKLTQKSYTQFSNINLKVLTPSIKEINEKTDINISVEPLKIGKKVHSLKFNVEGNKQKVIIKNTKSNNTVNPKSFTGYDQRQYTENEWNDIESKLLGWDK